MRYQIAPLFCRPWTLLGIKRELIESHYENNYGGAFARLNTISEELAALDPATTPPDVIRRLKQDEAAALNSLALHEIYFASLGGDGRVISELMANALARDFGSVDRWRSEFVALVARSAVEPLGATSSTFTATRSQPRSLLSIARLNSARSRACRSFWSIVRIAQTCFGLSGGFEPVNLPLFQGIRLAAGEVEFSISCMVHSSVDKETSMLRRIRRPLFTS